MPRKRDPRRDEAFNIFKKHDGNITNRAIANQLDVPEKTISSWKYKDKWNDELKGVLRKNEKSTPNKKNSKSEKQKPVNKSETHIIKDEELTDKQRLFCIYYVKNFNATMAAIKAGYSPDRAHVTGSELVRNRKVAEEIKRIKGKIQNELFIDEMDIINRYIKIAFADINDYVDFGNIEEAIVVENEETGEQETIKQKKNKIILKSSSEVDGSLITEVKTSRQGVSVKLEDRQKALEWLANFFDLNPNHKFKKEYDNKKLELERERFEHQKQMDEFRGW